MQAINHIATALILKKKFPSAPLLGLIVAAEAVEYLWVGLNIVGVERTVVDENMRSVADIHLVHMPFSHSVVTSGLIAILAGTAVLMRGGKAASATALAIGLAVFSHVVLDLLVHAPDIAFSPFLDGKKYGAGFYASLPLPALVLETMWGVLCWYLYRGSRNLLFLIVGLGLVAVPLYSAGVNIGEHILGGENRAFPLVILVQMLVTSGLVWIYARDKSVLREKVLQATA